MLLCVWLFLCYIRRRRNKMKEEVEKKTESFPNSNGIKAKNCRLIFKTNKNEFLCVWKCERNKTGKQFLYTIMYVAFLCFRLFNLIYVLCSIHSQQIVEIQTDKKNNSSISFKMLLFSLSIYCRRGKFQALYGSFSK